MLTKLICQVMGCDLDRSWYGFAYDPETSVFRWIAELHCRRCGWGVVRHLGAPPIG